MKKNGFIATSILYSFFLIFLTLFIGLVTNYLHNRILLARIEDTSREILLKINNTKLTDLSVGDHIKFATKDQYLLNSDATWTLAKTATAGDKITLYFISDLNAQNLDVLYQIPGEVGIKKMHPMTINLYEALINNNAYDSAIIYNGFKTEMVTSSFLSDIRNDTNLEEMIKDAILNPGGNYLVRIDTANDAYVSDEDGYYEIKRYNFPLGNEQKEILSKYCGGSFKEDSPDYDLSNTFGYMHVVNSSLTINQKYIDYCYYASPISYTHTPEELVVQIPESKLNDQISSKFSSAYTFRLITTITLDKNSNNTYIAGGKGTILDPYLFTDGRKQS